MKVKVSTAEGPALDWMVAKCEGYFSRTPLYWESADGAAHFIKMRNATGHGVHWTHSTTDWAEGGPILTNAHISRTIDHSGLWIAYWTDGYDDSDAGKKWMQCDRSELVAGLRCYVASKLGEEVEVPDELS